MSCPMQNRELLVVVPTLNLVRERGEFVWICGEWIVHWIWRKVALIFIGEKVDNRLHDMWRHMRKSLVMASKVGIDLGDAYVW